MLDYHALKREVKTVLIARWQPELLLEDPLSWAWCARALSNDGTQNNPLLGKVIEHARQWLEREETWVGGVNLAAIAMLCTQMLALGDGCCIGNSEIIPAAIREQRQKGLSKFSRLNDPYYIYGLAVGARDFFAQDDAMWLRQHAEHSIQMTNLRRGLLFAAASVELGGTPSTLTVLPKDVPIHDMLVALWTMERHGSLIPQSLRQGMWDAYECVKDGINWTEAMQHTGAVYTASVIDLAMFYEALITRTSAIDFIALFNNFPWHTDVRSSAESLFRSGEYVNAVFEAAKFFIDEVKTRAGHPIGSDGRPLDGGNLITNVFRGNPPTLKFNALVSVADRDEQRGLCLLAEGIVAAVRNPKGHVPKAQIVLSPEEAVEQLVIISHLMRRLDTAST